MPSSRTTKGKYGQRHGFHRVDDALGDDVALHDTTKDIHEDRFDVAVGNQNLEGFGDLLFRRATPDVEEIGRATAGVLNDVHRPHGQTGTIDETGDIAIETNVIEAELARFHLAGIFFGHIAIGHDLRMAEHRVVVEVELGIERHDFAFRRQED